MNPHTILARMLLPMLLAACGGGDHAVVAAPATIASAESLPSTVPIEGCVLDVTGRPLALPVQATAADGRLVASAMSDADGIFRMHVPVLQDVQLAPVSAGEALNLRVGSTSVTLGGCLRGTLA